MSVCCFACAMGALGFLRNPWSIVDVRGGALLIVEVMVLMKVLWNVPHVGPAFLAILFRIAVWHVGPYYPCARARGLANGSPTLGVGERLVEAEVRRWGAIKMRDGKDEAGLELIKDGGVR